MIKKFVDHISGLNHEHIDSSIYRSCIGMFFSGKFHESSRKLHIIDKLEIIVVADDKSIEFELLAKSPH